MAIEPKFDVLCAGILVADHVCAPIPNIPGAGQLVMTQKLSLSIGGCAANVAMDLRRLGLNVGVVGRIGTDALGTFVRDTLASAGVDAAHVLVTPGEQTSATLVINVRGEDRRFIHDFGANTVFNGSEVTAELIGSARLLYLGGFFLMPNLDGEHVAKMFRLAREAGVPTVLDVVIPDPTGCWQQIEKVLPWTDVFLPNYDEACQLTGLDDPLEQAERFHAAGAAAVAVTCGRDGLFYVDARRRLRASSFTVPFVDGTGSGDAFAAGFISGMLAGESPERCLELGSALGASCVRQAGATTGVFTRDELKEFLSANLLTVTPV